MSSPPAKRTRRSTALTKTSNVDKTTMDAPMATRNSTRKAKAKTRGNAVKMDSHRTAQDSEQAKPTKSTSGKISSQKANSIQSGASSTDDPLPAARKQKSKALNKQEREKLLSLLDSVDLSILKREVCMKLEEQFIPEYLKEMTTMLSEGEQPLEAIIMGHRYYFSTLYKECQKGSESFVRFQVSWHQHCSAFLLSSQYSLRDINLEESKCDRLVETRGAWLKFCEDCGIPVPESNPIMLTVSSAIYHFLLDFVASFDNSAPTTGNINLEMDGDDVYYRFGGGALSDMLHLRYKQIRACRDDQRDLLSQEISILHCMNLKDKSQIPEYLKYRDRGYMYFPDTAFLPLIREIDTSVKEVVNFDGLQQGDGLIKLAHERINSQTRFCEMFREMINSKLPSDITTYNVDAIDNVYSTFVRKICNTRIQELLSATKQQLATKKGLASTVDVNLRTTLLAHHAKLQTKLGSKE